MEFGMHTNAQCTLLSVYTSQDLAACLSSEFTEYWTELNGAHESF